MEEDLRIGVFICECGQNIAGIIDIGKIEEYAKSLPAVSFVGRSRYACYRKGLRDIREAITREGLNRVVIAACTPRTHEPLFQETIREAGLNPYLFEMANIRDQCSWVHGEIPEKATRKAKDLIRMGVARASLLEPQAEVKAEVNPAAVVIGAGVAGMAAALSLARLNYPVKLVEKESRVGGLLNDLNQLYPLMQKASDFLAGQTSEVEKNPNIELLANTTVIGVEGYIGNYQVSVSRDGTTSTLPAGVIIIATGAEVFSPEGLFNYNGKNVITQFEFEQVLRDGKKLKTKDIVMVQCVGSRTENRPYCSRICCTTALKNAGIIKEKYPATGVHLVFRDLQMSGVLREKDIKKLKELGVKFYQYLPSQPPEVKDKSVEINDQLSGQKITLTSDLTVLSTPLVAPQGSKELSTLLRKPIDEYGFISDPLIKLRPVNYAPEGIFICGCAHWPADVGESISQGYRAAAQAAQIFKQAEVETEPIVSHVDEELCIACGLCESICRFNAIRLIETDKGMKSRVFPILCKGCGTCGAGCPMRAITMHHFKDEQISAQIAASVAS